MLDTRRAPATVALLQSRAGVASSPFADPGIIRSIYNGGNSAVADPGDGGGHRDRRKRVSIRHPRVELLATPHRVRMLLGKAAALLIFGVIFGITSVAAGMLVSIPFVLGNGASFLLDQPATWRSIILGVLDRALDLDRHGHRNLDQNMLVALVVGVLRVPRKPIVSVVFFLKRWDQLLNLMPSGATNAMLKNRPGPCCSPVTIPHRGGSPPWFHGLVRLLPALAGLLSAASSQTLLSLPALHRFHAVCTGLQPRADRREPTCTWVSDGGGGCCGGIPSGGQAVGAPG